MYRIAVILVQVDALPYLQEGIALKRATAAWIAIITTNFDIGGSE